MPPTATVTTPRRTAGNSISLRVVPLAVLGAVAALVAGCASTSGNGVNGFTPGSHGAAGPASAVPPPKPGGMNTTRFELSGQCPTSAADPAIAKLQADKTQVPLPADFHAVAAVRCEKVVRTVLGDGEWQFADALRADSGLTALVAALREPSQTPPTGMYACAAIGIVLPDFGLVDAAGQVIRPQLPQSFCNQPLPQVLTAISTLPWRTEAEQRLNQTQNQAEIDSGCYPQYKDVFELPLAASPQPWSKTRHPAENIPPMACLYTTAPGSSDDFVRGTRLDGAQQATVSQALSPAASVAAPQCSAKATRFAVLFVGDAAGVGVELDGCKRVLWPNGFLAPAPAMLLSALGTLGIG